MAIVLEGPDAAGKSTLARTLQNQFGMKMIVAGGAPKTPADVVAYCRQQVEACNDPANVIDRVTPISHPIYNPVYRGSQLLKGYLQQIIDNRQVIIVYCRPPVDALMRPEKHQWKDYDTEEDKQKILNNQMVYIDLYDETFLDIPHVPYDYTQAEEDQTIHLVAMLGATKTSPQAIEHLREIALVLCR